MRDSDRLASYGNCHKWDSRVSKDPDRKKRKFTEISRNDSTKNLLFPFT